MLCASFHSCIHHFHQILIAAIDIFVENIWFPYDIFTFFVYFRTTYLIIITFSFRNPFTVKNGVNLFTIHQ